MSSTPSPTASMNAVTPTTSITPGSAGNNMSNQSRRPPRKSTLTQQQKNQKRQRATQDQLGLLEIEFNKNPTPTGTTRERIAQEINMTERSVQIWFQNRRAKIKLMAKKSLETGEDIDLIPETYRTYLAIQAHESGKPFPRHFMGSGHPMSMGGHGMMMGGDVHNSQKTLIEHFVCRSLNIGTWRRVKQNHMDLVIFYSLGEKPSITYYINNESAGYKIEYPFSHIKSISLNNQPDDTINRPAGLSIELNRPPNFFMDSSGLGGFYQCGDFTEHQQASQIMTHYLGGDPNVLGGQLAKLSLLESFQNRHLPAFFDASAMAMAAAQIPRPASQPNAMPPPPPPNVFHDNGFGMSLQPGPRGHKRTRSRSVPAITDFSFLQHPTPSFHIQHPSTTITDPSIFASVPQQSHNLSAGNNLRINTAHGYELGDYRQYPMSAATTNSPSEYASPGFFGVMNEAPVSAGLQPGFTVPFLSPMPEHATPAPAVGTPLSAVSHHDPIIADHSPPLSNIHRSASADFLLQDDSAITFDDDTVVLSEMYQKHMQLPIRPGMPMSAPHTPAKLEEHQDEFGFNFGTIDPSTIQQGL